MRGRTTGLAMGVMATGLLVGGCSLYFDEPAPDPGPDVTDPDPDTGTEIRRSCVRAIAGGDLIPGGYEELAITYVCDCCGIVEHLWEQDGVIAGGDARGDYQPVFGALLVREIEPLGTSVIAVGEDTGSWVFTARNGQSLATPSGFRDIWIGDVDGLDWQDILVAAGSSIGFVASAVSMPYELAVQQNLLTGKPFRAVTRAHLGGSAAPDLFYATTAGELGVAIQTAAMPLTFAPPEVVIDPPTSTQVLPLVTVDLDGDGIEDVAGSAGHVFVRSSKAGTLAFLDQPASALAAGDIDGDGTADLLFITANRSVVGRVTIAADGSLSSHLLVAKGGDAIAVAKLDGDALADIALVDHIVPPGPSPEMESTITIIRGADL